MMKGANSRTQNRHRLSDTIPSNFEKGLQSCMNLAVLIHFQTPNQSACLPCYAQLYLQLKHTLDVMKNTTYIENILSLI